MPGFFRNPLKATIGFARDPVGRITKDVCKVFSAPAPPPPPPAHAPSRSPDQNTITINIEKDKRNAEEERRKRHQEEMEQMRKQQEMERKKYELEREQQKLKYDMELKCQKQRHESELDHHQQQNQLQIKQTKISVLYARKTDLCTEKQRIINDELAPIDSKLSQITKQVMDEEKAISPVAAERVDLSRKLAVLIGNVGDGKSSLGNRLSGDTSDMADHGPYKTSHGSRACTQTMQKSMFDNVSLVDCPGWNEAKATDRTHAIELCAFLRGCGGINAFIVVRNATNCRFDANFQDKLRDLGYMFGDAFWKHLILVLTRVDKGIAERQFLAGNKVKEMKMDVAKLCHGLNNDVSVIGIGLDNYDGKLQMIADAIPNHRFSCEDIKSPIDALKLEKTDIIQQRNKIQQRITSIGAKIQDIDTQITKLSQI